MSQPNHLLDESSPYLRQHAYNPVDWYPWGEEALAKSRALDRPIFLSIGYSACHWCHVMEHESFEDPDVGAILNESFISIKVDREERPDLDQVYMTAVQLMTQHGGWPMSVFLTPKLEPFYGGTYFPPDERYPQMPSFKRLILSLAEAWKNRREAVEEQATHWTANVRNVLGPRGEEGVLTEELLRNAGKQLAHAFEPRYGGFGTAPKFPHPMDLRLLLRLWKRFGDDQALAMVRTTLDAMGRGGIYDQLGGGFHRYSTDARWLVPHFEKMLYDNALLVSTYVEAYQVTGAAFYCTIIEETLGYVLREMTSPAGPFFSTQDADSEGVEGKFFVWSLGEIREVLGPDADFFAGIYDVTPEGNWEGHNILHLGRSDEQEAKMSNLPQVEIRKKLDDCRAKLLAVRNKRIWPARDEKILTAWNGLMIGAFAQAYMILEKPEYLQAAQNAATFVLAHMRTPEGRLLRTTSAGGAAKLNAYLEDYAYLIDALVSLYEASFHSRWLAEARDLAHVMIEQFWDEAAGAFFYTGKDHEELLARTKDTHDNAVPSGNAMAATGLLRLFHLTGEQDFFDKARRTLELQHTLLATSPLAAGQMLCALDFYLGPVQEIVVVGAAANDETKQVLKHLRKGFRPSKVLALKDVVGADDETLLPLLADKPKGARVATYVCTGFACQRPLIGVEEVARDVV